MDTAINITVGIICLMLLILVIVSPIVLLAYIVLDWRKRELKLSQRNIPTSTVGRGRSHVEPRAPEQEVFREHGSAVYLGDSLEFYQLWESPTVIVSDGAYGVLGFEGDTSDHLDLPRWYEPHIEQWAKFATPRTTLWFWNSEIGWATVHPILERHGWRYVNANVWNKGKGHIAGNVNTSKIRRFPVVSEVCVQYAFEAKVGGVPIKKWLLTEWDRSGLPRRLANEACGVKDVVTRKYFDQGHLWYFPPPEMFGRLAAFANEFGRPDGRPYYSRDGLSPMTEQDWAGMRNHFRCPHGVTNVWDRPAVRGAERLKGNGSGKALHLNQKPLDLISMTIEASSELDDVVWEPFGGTFTACVAARRLNRRFFGAEIDPTYFQHGIERISREAVQPQLL